ncbi:conserved hypothetical protein [Leishmania major strain Friedlin]|uniref:Cyclin N-terminal domain-containing protein n=1 Tax=Leishmania major TaxID=5664 RepID=Q4QA13_LEIMA|nr:conserved hypothetical protein [Leishmania major strain Friedlin]CAG9575094.1 hypothetical_protein_-_conserved [Leishmania major strain Friedlin]CAJ04975.1 conserved hypothetical protein [Leishmania major strain Friedlin]|eukprot:XP_001683835.1 conserved hypothetical protein [Leishmania major strain Friedlin]
MSTAVFQLFSKLAGVTSTDQQRTSSAFEMAPPQMLLPTDEECVLYGQKKPIVFFYEPRGAQQLASGAADGNSGPGAGAAVTSSSRTNLLQGWPAELSAAQLTSPGTAVHALRVTNAEDDFHKTLSTQEVWADWPQTIRGWQLCPMSHLCAVVRTNGAAPHLYLLASRYELVGTSAVYERYLLLTPPSKDSGRDAASNVLVRAATAADSASISVTELRTLRRIACLCRCFCSSGAEAQPRTARSRGVSNDTLAPPPPLADYVLHLVPTSLQYTFCFAATALLSAADEERCQSWAMTATALSRLKFSSHHQSCSTIEAANTSGALSDGGHTTYFESATQSRDRSTSAVRVVEGGGGGTTSASGAGFSEDPRSAPSTPARPLFAMGRMDEQRGDSLSAARHHEDMHEDGESILEERLPPSQRWRAMALRRLLDTSFYDEQVPAGWRRWRYASSGILCRPLVVDSLDGIVRYIHGSRLAFYTAVAFLDRFIAVTVDPLANFFAYKRQLQRGRSRQEMDCRMLAMHGTRPTDPPIAAELHAEQLCDSGLDGGVQAREICSFLTQVIVVCIMLGSKTVDLYPPRIRSLMGCVEDTAPISEEDFVILEFHVLLTLGFPVHPVTLFEAVGALLTFSTSDDLYGTLTASHTTRRLLEEHQDRGHLIDDVDRLMQEEAEEEEAAAVAGSAQPHPALRAAALTPAGRRAINDWLRLRLFTCFICDEVIRANAGGSAASSSASASSASDSTPRHRGGGVSSRMAAEEESKVPDGGFSVLQFSPVLVAAAALVIAAEQLRVPLPAPMLRLVPAPMQARLREAPADGSSDVGRSSGGSSSGRVMAASRRRDQSMSTCEVVMEESNMLGRGAGADAGHNEASTGLRLTAGATDDHYKVLVELSLLLEQELNRLSDDSGLYGPPPLASVPAAGATPTSINLEVEEEQVGAGSCGAAAVAGPSPCPTHPYTGALSRGGTARRGAPLTSAASPRVRPASTRAIDMFGRIIAHAKAIHYRSRESCPPVLLHRYQPLFRDGV